ncbi:polyprenyl synthetase family protein [Dermabacteraceae bacterium P13088]
MSQASNPLIESVKADISEFLSARREELTIVGTEVTALLTLLEQYLEGGKMLRPQFCYWAGALAAGDRIDSVRPALTRLGAAIELLQAAALLHDDVIDHSPTRRGRPAAHKAAEAEHRVRVLAGSSADFGIAAAIVLGDMSLTWSEQMAGPDLAREPEARHVWDAMRTEVMAGQYLDVLNQVKGLLPQEDAVYEELPTEAELSKEQNAQRVIRWKTVPYTILRPMQLGARMAGGDDELHQAIADFAIPLGTAFQLRDDLLGVFGDEAVTGKSSTSDLLEGKRTVLLARTEKAASGADAKLLKRTVGKASSSAEDIAKVRELMVETGASESVRADVRSMGELAASSLDRLAEMTDAPQAIAELRTLLHAASSLDDVPQR